MLTSSRKMCYACPEFWYRSHASMVFAPPKGVAFGFGVVASVSGATKAPDNRLPGTNMHTCRGEKDLHLVDLHSKAQISADMATLHGMKNDVT